MIAIDEEIVLLHKYPVAIVNKDDENEFVFFVGYLRGKNTQTSHKEAKP